MADASLPAAQRSEAAGNDAVGDRSISRGRPSDAV